MPKSAQGDLVAAMNYSTPWFGVIALLTLLSACGNDNISSWDTTEYGLYSASLSNDGTLALLGVEGLGGTLWDTSEGSLSFQWNHTPDKPSQLVATDFNKDNRFALTAEEATLVLWEVSSGEPLSFFNVPAPIRLAQLSANAGSALLALDDNSLILFDIQKGGLLLNLAVETKITAIALSPDGDHAAVSVEDNPTRILSVNSGAILHTIEHKGRMRTALFSPDSKRLFLSGSNVEPSLWSVDTGNRLAVIQQKRGNLPGYYSFLSAGFSDDGTKLLTGDASGRAQLWDSRTGLLSEQWNMPRSSFWLPKSFALVAVALSPDNEKAIAVNSGGTTFVVQI